MAQTTALVDALKQVLKEQSITYRQVAEHLDMSLASVKRLFSEKQFSLKRLDAVCEYAGIEISDLARRVEQQRRISQLSLEQEQQLVEDEKLLIIAVSALNRWSFDDIIKAYDFSEADMIQNLAQLDRMKMIDLLPGNRIKPLITTDFQWQKNGPIQRFFETQVQQDFFQSRFNGPGEIRLFVTGMLTPASNSIMQQKMERLAMDFRRLHQEDLAQPLADRYGTSLVLAMRPWELEFFLRHRRPGTKKVFPG
ncbi:MAG: helix-turn-helix domain-containing protein [Pseudomonadota bacterium]|nr:helix-turn-helix domain-containing protein [Pseudomonadota bacterium]